MGCFAYTKLVPMHLIFTRKEMQQIVSRVYKKRTMKREQEIQ